MSKVKFENGNEWIRSDFHLHTNADKEFKYNGEVNSYINDYVSQLKSSGIQLGVITNHNKFAKEEFNKLRKKARRENIGLLPGVELSVNDGANGVHLLVIFSDEWLADGQDHINSFLSVTFAGKVPEQYEQENGRSNDNILKTLKKLESYNRKFCVIFAHVEAPSGLWNEVAGGRMKELAKNPLIQKYCKGFQKVRTINKPDKVNREKVKSWWGDSYPAEIEGSDPKQISEIGRGNHCFLNIGDFSFDAVSYALSDFNYRVAKEIPKIKHSNISAVRFEGGLLDQVRIPFSPSLNCLIGIRGSGKSSILESIRYALDLPMGDNPQDKKYKNSLLPHILKSGGKITIEAVDRHGKNYEISKILGSSADVYQEGKHISNSEIISTVIVNPLYFGQKDLASAGSSFGHDLVEKIVKDDLVGVRNNISEKATRVAACIESLESIENEVELLESAKSELVTVQFKLEQLDNHDIKEKLAKQVDFDNDVQFFTNTESNIKESVDSLFTSKNELIAVIENIQEYKSNSNDDKIQMFINKVSELKVSTMELNDAFEIIKKKLSEITGEKDNLVDEKNSLKEEFAEIERTLVKSLEDKDIYSVKPNEYLELSTKKTELETSIKTLTEQTEKLAERRESLLTAITELRNAWREEFVIIRAALEKINDAQESLFIEAGFRGDKDFISKNLEDKLKGNNIRKDSYDLIAKSYDDFGEIYKDIDVAKNNAKSKSEDFKSAFLENIRNLLVCQIPNTYKVIFRGKPLRAHSLGQRASAMMLFILSQNDNDLLLIDQPEDDLDNQTIYDDVVKLIRKMKPNQQFIFATHNANFPVLGDADQLVSCELSEDKIDVHIGSIDNKVSQQKIVKVMEGGAEAFTRRKSIYHIWEADIS
ncbi:TrlF family AAA-like ATPase [Pseudoalteromonas rubra]|uniref:TrlF family AAA-like ATPase n=1 Tax=Pseudoalteromonas rubra TaxID=43658 RepID=UPI000F782A0A|nr:hypothetical protein [Pseudoalteromonas rubra]